MPQAHADHATVPLEGSAEPRPGSAPWEWSGSAQAGAILIVVGAIFLLRGYFGIELDNWWALFIAIPGVLALLDAYREYERKGERVDRSVVQRALVGAAPLAVALIFLLELDWGEMWPVFVIIGGLWALYGGKERSRG